MITKRTIAPIRNRIPRRPRSRSGPRLPGLPRSGRSADLEGHEDLQNGKYDSVNGVLALSRTNAWAFAGGDKVSGDMAGKWSITGISGTGKRLPTFSQMSLIPGTTSLWGVGDLSPKTGSNFDGAIFSYQG